MGYNKGMEANLKQAHEALAMVEEPLPCGAGLVDTTQAIEPMIVEHKPAKTIAMKKEEVVHRALDAKLKDPVKLDADLENLDLMRWAKFVNCLSEKQVKVEANITGSMLLGLFPIAVDQ